MLFQPSFSRSSRIWRSFREIAIPCLRVVILWMTGIAIILLHIWVFEISWNIFAVNILGTKSIDPSMAFFGLLLMSVIVPRRYNLRLFLDIIERPGRPK